MSNKSITSLAILKVNWDERHFDYIENFVPFFANLIKIKKYTEIDIAVLKDDFEKEYGLSIPHHPIKVILGRLKAKGLIYKKEHKFFVDTSYANNADFDTISTTQQRELNKLIKSLIEFARDKYSTILNEKESEEAILGFFREEELSFLFATDEKNILPSIEVSKSNKFIVAKFIQVAQKEDPELFNFIVDIAVGNALAATIVYGGDFQNFTGRIKGLNLYLDTGYIFSLLGLNGEGNRQAFEGLTQTFISEGVKLFIFEHTYDEIMRILNAALYWMKHENYDPHKASRVLKYFLAEERTETDVEIFIAQIGSLLGKFKIRQASKPDYNDAKVYQIDEAKLKELIIEAYQHDPFFDEAQKEETIKKDIESFYSICKLRKGRVAYTLKDASHVFVTTNKILANISKRIYGGDNASFSIPPFITDIFIGTVVWLHAPIKAKELNTKRLIADAYAAIQPDASLIQKYVDQIEALKKQGRISGNEYYFLRTNRIAFNLLSEKTKNDSNNFHPITTKQILDEINEKHLLVLKEEIEERRRAEANNIELLRIKDESLKQAEKDNEIIAEKHEKLLNIIAKFISRLVSPVVLAGVLFAILIDKFPYLVGDDAIARGLSLLIIMACTVGGFNIKGFNGWLFNKVKNYLASKI